MEDDSDGSQHVRSFGLDVAARFELGEALGLVHATLVRPFTWPDAQGRFENGGFWGLVEFHDNPSDHQIARLWQGDYLRLEPVPDRAPRLPYPSLVVQPVRVVRGDRPRWLVVEVEE